MININKRLIDIKNIKNRSYFSTNFRLSFAKPLNQSPYYQDSTSITSDKPSLNLQILKLFNDLNDSIKLVDLTKLINEASFKSYFELGCELPYESTPDKHRFIDTSKSPTDEILIIAHIIKPNYNSDLLDFRINTCGGFAIAADGNDNDPLIVSCTHTLNDMKTALIDMPKDSSSATLIINFDHDGIKDVRYASEIPSCLPMNDIVFYKPSHSLLGKSNQLRCLPVNPYPPQISTKVAVWLPPTVDNSKWVIGSIDRYTTPNGRRAQTGTYDHLANVEINDAIPKPGASGSPIVEVESGSVCGIVKGSLSTYPKAKGWATPSERIFESFLLPGLRFN